MKLAMTFDEWFKEQQIGPEAVHPALFPRLQKAWEAGARAREREFTRIAEAQAKLAETTAEINAKTIQSLQGLLAEAQAQCAAMRNVLKSVEWVPIGSKSDDDACPRCREFFGTHISGCRLSKALAGGAGRAYQERMEKLERIEKAARAHMATYCQSPDTEHELVEALAALEERQ